MVSQKKTFPIFLHSCPQCSFGGNWCGRCQINWYLLTPVGLYRRRWWPHTIAHFFGLNIFDIWSRHKLGLICSFKNYYTRNRHLLKKIRSHAEGSRPWVLPQCLLFPMPLLKRRRNKKTFLSQFVYYSDEVL